MDHTDTKKPKKCGLQGWCWMLLDLNLVVAAGIEKVP
jgi:hypothetical protein